MAIFSVLFALFTVQSVIGGIIGGDDMELIQTPHGYRPSKCVIQHTESPVEITELEDGSGVKVWYPTSKISKFIPTDQDCLDNVEELFKPREDLDGKSYGLEAWEDYASFTTSSEVGNFTSTYQIPNESPAGTGQLLYYFIGFQNNDDSGVSIVQPVVNYDKSGQFPSGWSMEPWNCCPAGQSHTGKNVVMAAGEDALAWIYAEGGTKDVVIGQSKADGSSPTVLTVRNNGRSFDWACATLEDYSASCSETNAQPFNCTNMVITDLKGSNVALDWKSTGQASCHGGAVVSSDKTSVYIYGHDSPGN